MDFICTGQVYVCHRLEVKWPFPNKIWWWTLLLCIHPHSNRSQHTVGTGFESRRMVCVPQLAATASSPSSKYNESKNKQVNIEAGSHSGGNICAKRGVFILHWHCWLIVNLCWMDVVDTAELTFSGWRQTTKENNNKIDGWVYETWC